MTGWDFTKRLPKWAVVEAAERIGFDRTRFVFFAIVGVLAFAIMTLNRDDADAIERIAAWVVYTLPAMTVTFAAYAIYVGLCAVRSYFRLRGAFRFEALERNNFTYQFDRQLDESTIDGGEF